METWLIYALLATLFAGLTSVLAKFGMKDLNADLGLAVRTCVVFILVSLHLFAWKGMRDFGELGLKNTPFLVLSGITTALSWIFYYRAMQLGTVSYVATIDKGSILITLLLSYLILKEPISTQLLVGAGFIATGLLILVWK